MIAYTSKYILIIDEANALVFDVKLLIYITFAI